MCIYSDSCSDMLSDILASILAEACADIHSGIHSKMKTTDDCRVTLFLPCLLTKTGI